jgi:hypothetical protein
VRTVAAEPKHTQKTRPRKGKPVEVTVPTLKEVEHLMRVVTGARPFVAKSPPKKIKPS